MRGNNRSIDIPWEDFMKKQASFLYVILLACTAAYGQITPLGDSYTNTADATTNYGSKTLLDVDGASQITYIQFNLASIPAGASVSQATLKLYVNTVTTAGSFNVDYVSGAWTENTIDATNAPALGGAIASGVAITTADKNQYILINVTSAVQAWLSGSETNNGLALVANSTFNATFDSKENTTTSHPPELDIAFAGGNGTITGVTTASGSGLTGGGTSGTLNLSLTNACATNQVLQWNGSAWACASAGTGTISGVTAGTDLTGGGTSGNVTLNLNTTALNSAYAQLAVANTFTPQQVIKGNGGNAIIGDPGCGSGFSGIGLNSALSGCNNYTMIGKSSGDVYINTTSTGSIHFRNNNGGGNSNSDLVTIDHSGNLTAAGTVLGQTTITAGYGVQGSSGNVGVFGQASGDSKLGSTTGEFAGVWGDTGGDSDTLFYGVLGTADDHNAGAFLNNPGSDTGVFGATLLAENDGTGSASLVFAALNQSGTSTCSINASGDLSCTGTVSGVVRAGDGARKVMVHAVQSPENWFEDFGSGTLVNGAASVALDPTFASTVNTTTDYHVFVTPRGECEGLYVANLTASGFEVRELHHGTSSTAFDYRIVAKRAGYENQRLEDVTERYQKMQLDQRLRRERMQQRRTARLAAEPVSAGAISPRK
jgi:hypothetical protein